MDASDSRSRLLQRCEREAVVYWKRRTADDSCRLFIILEGFYIVLFFSADQHHGENVVLYPVMLTVKLKALCDHAGTASFVCFCRPPLHRVANLNKHC